MADEVVYRRASGSGYISCAPRATNGRTAFEVNDIAGMRTSDQVNDYLIQVCDLVLDGLRTDPQMGDEIVDGDDIFQVASPSPNEPPWRFSDNFRTVFRIHTKWVGAVTN